MFPGLMYKDDTLAFLTPNTSFDDEAIHPLVDVTVDPEILALLNDIPPETQAQAQQPTESSTTAPEVRYLYILPFYLSMPFTLILTLFLPFFIWSLLKRLQLMGALLHAMSNLWLASYYIFTGLTCYLSLGPCIATHGFAYPAYFCISSCVMLLPTFLI